MDGLSQAAFPRSTQSEVAAHAPLDPISTFFARSRLRRLACTLVCAITTGGPAPEFTGDKARTLDTLFAELSRSALQPEADRVVERILKVWARSGRSDIDLLLAKADAAIQTRSYGLATLLLDEVVDDAPLFAEGWNRRATLRVIMGDTAGALSDIEKTLALEPRHFGALAGRGMIHVGAGRWAEALAAYRAALAVNPFLPERHHVIPELERKVERGRL